MTNGLTGLLRRGDLSFSKREALSIDLVENETCFTPDVVHLVEHDERAVIEQCLIENYDYCADAGSSWTWTPLSFGPVKPGALKGSKA